MNTRSHHSIISSTTSIRIFTPIFLGIIYLLFCHQGCLASETETLVSGSNDIGNDKSASTADADSAPTAPLSHVEYPFFYPNVKLHQNAKLHALKYNSSLSITIPERWLQFNPKPNFVSDAVLHLDFNDDFYLHDHFFTPQQDKEMTNNSHDSTPEDPIFDLSSSDSPMVIWVVCMASNIVKYSNKRLFETGLRMGLDVRLMDAEQFKLIASTEDTSGANFQILYNGANVEPPDVVLTRIGSKVNHFALGVLFHLEKMGIRVLNGFEAHVSTGDKLYQLQQLAQLSFPIPKSLLLGDPIGRQEDKLKIIANEFQFPIILKKLKGLQGKGIILVNDLDQFNDLEQIIDDREPYLIQEYVSLSRGRDIRIFVVGGKTIGAMMRIAKEGFKSNYHLGGFVKQVKLNERLEWMAAEASNHLSLDIAGVDILIGNGTYQICEVNSSPGFMGLEAATGEDIATRILTWVSMKANLFERRGR